MGCTSSNEAACTGVGGGGGKGKMGNLFFQKFTLGPKLGKGAFAQVRVATCTDHSVDTEKPLAVKIMDLRADQDGAVTGPLADLCNPKLDSAMKQDAIQEAGVWRKAGQHPQIIGLVDAFLECGASFFIMEMCDSSLLKFLEKGANHMELNERALGFVFKQNLLACQHIHSLGIVHRDIKPDNYMVQGQAVKLCDFGLAAVLTGKSGLTGVNGTAPYMAPEMLKGARYGAEVDIWSVGVMTYTLFFGKFPYNGKELTAKEMKRAIRDCNVKPPYEPIRGGTVLAPKVSEPAVSFCKGLLHRVPTKRWKLHDALACDFVKACETLDDSLPSMLPMLSSAKRSGVFDKRRLELPEKLDKLLERLHKEFRGAPMNADVSPKKRHDDDTTTEASSGAGWDIASNLWKQSGSSLASVGTCDSSVYSGAQLPTVPIRPNEGCQHHARRFKQPL